MWHSLYKRQYLNDRILEFEVHVCDNAKYTVSIVSDQQYFASFVQFTQHTQHSSILLSTQTLSQSKHNRFLLCDSLLGCSSVKFYVVGLSECSFLVFPALLKRKTSNKIIMRNWNETNSSDIGHLTRWVEVLLNFQLALWPFMHRCYYFIVSSTEYSICIAHYQMVVNDTQKSLRSIANMMKNFQTEKLTYQLNDNT